MPKITLDRAAFKALASDSRLDILRTLDGKKLSLKDISKETNLNKATLHEHLTKLNEAGLVKRKTREGHKFVYYSLSWKGESLLHPENTKIVVMFSATLLSLFGGILLLIQYVKGTIIATAPTYFNSKYLEEVGSNDSLVQDTINEITTAPDMRSYGTWESGGDILFQNPIFLYATITCIIIFTIILCFSIWKVWENRTQKL